MTGWIPVPHQPMNPRLLPLYWEVVQDSRNGHLAVLGKNRARGGAEAIDIVIRIDYASVEACSFQDIRIELAHCVAQSLSRLAHLGRKHSREGGTE